MARLEDQELAARIAARLGFSAKKASRVLDALREEVTEALLDGEEVLIPGLVVFYPADAPPRVRKNRRSGAQEVVPVRRVVKARVLTELKDRVAAGNRVAGLGLLVSGEGDEFADELEERLSRQGVKCCSGRTLKEALRKAGKMKSADFLVFTPSVPEEVYDATVLRVKLQRSSAFLPILRGLFDRKKIERPSGFKVVPDGIFSSPVEVARQVAGELERWREEKHYFKRQVRLRSASDPETIESFVEVLRKMARGIFRDAVESEKFQNAFPEAIENAAIHGNGSMADKYVDVTWLEDAKRVVITVEDEGGGFDYKRTLETARADSAEVVRKRMRAGEPTGGLGVKLLLAAFDKVEYQAGGSKVVLTKMKG